MCIMTDIEKLIKLFFEENVVLDVSDVHGWTCIDLDYILNKEYVPRLYYQYGKDLRLYCLDNMGNRDKIDLVDPLGVFAHYAKMYNKKLREGLS